MMINLISVLSKCTFNTQKKVMIYIVSSSLFLIAGIGTASPNQKGATPSETQINNLAVDFYNTQGQWAGIFTIDHIEKTRIEKINNETINAHIRYFYNPIPGNRLGRNDTGYDQRVFYLVNNNSKWKVVNMGDYMSGNLNIQQADNSTMGDNSQVDVKSNTSISASSDVNSPDSNTDKSKPTSAVTTPAGYGSNSSGRSQLLVDAGKCKIYSENEPVGKVDWKGPCAKGFANGEGITRYYSADNQLFAIGKDRYQKGQYKSTKDAYFLNEGKIMRKPKKSASESAEEVSISAVPAWAREITGQDSSAFASNGKSQNNANASSKGIPLRAVFSFDMNDTRSDGHLPIVFSGAGRGESEIRNLAEFRANRFCKKGSFDCASVSNLKIQKTCKGSGFVAFAKISTKNDADFLGYHWWADCLDKKNLAENIPSIKKQLSEGLAQARIVDYAIHSFIIAYVDENNISDIQKITDGANFVDESYIFTCKDELDKNLGYKGAPTTFNVEACIRNIESEYKSRFGNM